MGNGDHIVNFRFRQRLVRQYAEMVKIHQAGDHDLNEVRPLRPCFRDQCAVLHHIVKAAPDEAAVMAVFMDRKCGRAVANAVLLGDLRRKKSDAPCVAAVAQVFRAAAPVFLQPLAHQRFIDPFLLVRNGGLPVNTVEHHVNVAVCPHTLPLFLSTQ